MNPSGKFVWGAVAITAAGTIGHLASRHRLSRADEAYAQLAARPNEVPSAVFHPDLVAGLPEIGQRYFLHAIAPGTPLYSAVELEMKGTFLLGDKNKYQTYSMTAREVIRSPGNFVWMPRMRSGALIITGSDGLVAGEAWSRFRLFGLIPVAQAGTSPDLVRSARFRGAVEGALSLPPSLLPADDVEWEQVGTHRARVTLRRFAPAIVLDLTLDEAGGVREVVGQRWSNVNADKIFKLQPFGGTAAVERTFQGLTIPTTIAAGNHFGTAEYLPFFQTRIVKASYF